MRTADSRPNNTCYVCARDRHSGAEGMHNTFAKNMMFTEIPPLKVYLNGQARIERTTVLFISL